MWGCASRGCIYDGGMKNEVDIAIIGGGAGGLSVGIWAGRLLKEEGLKKKVVIYDGAKRLGAKILVAGGGRCNVTHEKVGVKDFQGEQGFIKKVLRGLPVKKTVGWFEEMGVALKTEETGKLFPVSDSSRTVLEGLLGECQRVGVEIKCECRVKGVRKIAGGNGGNFEIEFEGEGGVVRAKRVIFCTGGRSLPKTGSDGGGWEIVRKLGHGVSSTYAALVPLNMEGRMFHAGLSGLSMMVRMETLVGGKVVDKRVGSMLWTHFGVSGPVVMDASRFWTMGKADGATVKMAAWADCDFQMGEQKLLTEGQQSPNKKVANFLSEGMVKRFVGSLLGYLGIDEDVKFGELRKEQRRDLVHGLTGLDLAVVSHRGWNYAEVTAGGVSLGEVSHKTMESKLVEGLYFCGEVLDCEGRIGGFNFQWAWAGGKLAGEAAVRSLEG